MNTKTITLEYNDLLGAFVMIELAARQNGFKSNNTVIEDAKTRLRHLLDYVEKFQNTGVKLESYE